MSKGQSIQELISVVEQRGNISAAISSMRKARCIEMITATDANDNLVDMDYIIEVMESMVISCISYQCDLENEVAGN